MPIYRLRPEAWPAARKRIITRMVLFMGGAMAFGVGIAEWKSGPEALGAWIYFVFAIPLFFSVRQAVRRGREGWNSFELEIEGETVERRQHLLPPRRLRRPDVQRIEETREGLVLRSATAANVVVVPAALERYDEAAALVRTWAPVTAVSPTRGPLRLGVTLVVVLGLLALAWINEGWMGATAAAAMAVFFLWILWVLQRSPETDARTRRFAWVLLLPAFSYAARAVLFWLR